jgi:hypothetical protein
MLWRAAVLVCLILLLVRSAGPVRQVYVAPAYQPAFELLGLRDGDVVQVHGSRMAIHF